MEKLRGQGLTKVKQKEGASRRPPPPLVSFKMSRDPGSPISPCKPQGWGRGHQISKEIPAAKESSRPQGGPSGRCSLQTGLWKAWDKGVAALFTNDLPPVLPRLGFEWLPESKGFEWLPESKGAKKTGGTVGKDRLLPGL